MNSTDEQIANRIKEVRVARGITQAELDDAVGLPISTISKIESGKRLLNAREITPLAKALGISTDFLLGLKTSFIYNEELEILMALREVPFDDFRTFLGGLEFSLFKTARAAKKSKKSKLQKTIDVLQRLSAQDSRPRGIDS